MKLKVIINKKVPYVKVLIVFILFHFAHSVTLGQFTIEETDCLISKFDSKEINYTEYIVKNKTQDTIYLWIDADTIDTDLFAHEKNILLFFRYIRTPKCELGLDFLCHDGSINFSEGYPPSPVIGCTFIKKILPDESFTIISLNGGINKEAIHYVQKKTASIFLSIKCLDEFCYDKQFILLW